MSIMPSVIVWLDCMSVHMVLWRGNYRCKVVLRLGRCLHGYEANCCTNSVHAVSEHWSRDSLRMTPCYYIGKAQQNPKFGALWGEEWEYLHTKFGSSTLLSSFYISKVRKLIVSSEICSFRTLTSLTCSIAKRYRSKFIFGLQIVRK